MSATASAILAAHTPQEAVTPVDELPTEKQVSYVESLIKARVEPEDQNAWRQDIRVNFWTKKAISHKIGTLQGMKPLPPRAQAPAPVAPAPKPERVVVEPGFYIVGEDIYKVVPVRRDPKFTYAQKLHGTNADGKPQWSYDRGAITLIANNPVKMTEEAAAEFGHTHGFCLCCGRLLTDVDSVARGIGPVCAARL